MNLKDYNNPVVNPHARKAVDNRGFEIEKYFGQTIIYLPPESVLQIGREDLTNLVQEFFKSYNLDDSWIRFHSDGIALELPSVRRSDYPITPNEEQKKELQKLWDKDPSLIFPDWHLPNNLVKKIYEISDIQS